MQIEIISVSQPETIPTKKGKSYQQLEVAYKKDGKIEGKKLVSFSNPAVFKFIKESKQGDIVNVTTIKDEKGYWQWSDVSSAEQSTSENVIVSTSSEKKPVSNYETREERLAKQQQIIRQSSLGHAVALLAANGGKKNTPEEVIEVATKFVSWVNDEKIDDGSIVSMQDDIPA